MAPGGVANIDRESKRNTREKYRHDKKQANRENVFLLFFDMRPFFTGENDLLRSRRQMHLCSLIYDQDSFQGRDFRQLLRGPIFVHLINAGFYISIDFDRYIFGPGSSWIVI